MKAAPKMIISDPYADTKRCVERLLEEYNRYGQLIIAYDYDNTIYDYHKKGYIFDRVRRVLNDAHNLGFHLTVFTSCNDDRLDEIRHFLKKNGIHFDSINETPDYIPFRGRKIYYNHMLDDRAGLGSALEILETVIASVRYDKVMFKPDGNPIDEIA